jgi:hypothetical protein
MRMAWEDHREDEYVNETIADEARTGPY